MSIKTRLQEEQKLAMRAKDKVRVKTIRSLIAAVKQIEIDDKIELDDDAVTTVVVKSVKQRKESITQFEKADRADLVDIEKTELAILEEFLPQALTAEEVDAHIKQAIASVDAQGMQDMGKVMGILQKEIQGRADMAAVSGLVRASLK
ncbi:GatB/YqeY domain-containing protein [Psychromonas sp. GE-S-Ul-11]|uniref:GatB/YqeY domain-containing protein n=1 Tax=Psychromonas sp. GE-S-Ul-11 TaxID=3241170 RepID=UPI00390C59C5